MENLEMFCKERDITSLGILSYEDKKKNWDNLKGLSGSQMGTLLKYPDELFAIKLGIKENVFTKKAEEKMKAGTELEGYIRQRYVDSLELTPEQSFTNFKGMPVSETFAKEYNGYTFTANIDGWLLECKNSEKPIEELVDFYYPQIQYYMWFFNTTTWDLATLQNGWKFNKRTVQYDADFVEEMLAKAIIFLGKLNTVAKNYEHVKLINKDLIEPFPWGVAHDTTIKTVLTEEELNMKDHKLIDELINTKLKIDLYSAKLEDIKGNVLARFNTGASIKGSKATISTSHVERQGNIDYKAIVMDKLNLTDEELDQYRNELVTYDQVGVRVKKGVSIDIEEDTIDEFDLIDLFD